jgi:hypothetical protein
MKKHIGKVISTGRKCVVVFREIYDDTGKVLEGDHCLVVETDSLSDNEGNDLMRITDSQVGQQSGNLFEVLNRERFTDGTNALIYLDAKKRFKKYPTNQIIMTPTPNDTIRLDVLNRVIAMQKAGLTEQQIQNAIQDDSDGAPRKETTAQITPSPMPDLLTEEVVSDDTIAKNLLVQAESFEAESNRLREEAYALVPSMKPSRGRPSKDKAALSAEISAKAKKKQTH